jgi:exodeoxyribonuclease VII large subunit
VISAVGHEIDFTIADFVADQRAPTPSAAAELVVKDRVEIQNYVHNLKNRMNNIIDNKIETFKLKLETKGTSYLKNIIQTKFADKRMHLDNLTIRFKSSIKSIFDSMRNKIAIQREKLIALNPNNILSRGYSITYMLDDDGKSVNIISADDVKSGDKIKTFLHDGDINSTVD